MGRRKSISLVDEVLKAKAEQDFEHLHDGKIALRLLAIRAAGCQHSLHEVADIFNITRQSIAKWVVNYRRKGVAGLVDRAKGHRRPRLGSIDQETVRGWLERSEDPSGRPIHWTIDLLRDAIETQLSIRLGRTRVWQLMRDWGYRVKVARPRHVKADAMAQDAFKKTSRNDSRGK